MARKPKAASSAEPELPVEPAQPAPGDTPAPTRRGRKPKASLAPGPVSAGKDETAASGASPALPVTGSASARGLATQRPRGFEEAAASFLLQEADATVQQPAPDADGPDAAAEPAAAGNDTITAGAAHPAGPGGNGDASLPASPAPAAKPAAQWDRATDTVRFDWAAIERTASRDGPNQAMAKLLVAARAEGANSRWPL